MAGVFHTVTLPVSPGLPRNLAFPAQDPGTLRTLTLDCTAWLRDAGTAIVSVHVTCDDPVSVADVTTDGNTVRLRVHGGTSGTVPALGFALTLANGDVEGVNVALSIGARLPGQIAGSQPMPAPVGPAGVVELVADDSAAIHTDTTAGNVFHVLLTKQSGMTLPQPLVAGATYLWLIEQGPGGSHPLMFHSAFIFAAGSPSVLSVVEGAVDILTAVTDGSRLYAVLTRGFA